MQVELERKDSNVGDLIRISKARYKIRKETDRFWIFECYKARTAEEVRKLDERKPVLKRLM